MRNPGGTEPLERINQHHADDLLAAARTLCGYPKATAARAERLDRAGIDLAVETPDGLIAARLTFAEPVPESAFPRAARAAFREIARRARTPG